MKTNVIMESEKDRELFGVVIRQGTKDSMLSLTDLQEAYTHARVLNGWCEKRIDHILTRTENVERIFYILFEQKIINVRFHTFMQLVDEKGIIKVLKELGVYKTTGARASKTIYCNSYLWVLIAMELNPMLYAKVITWLSDKLICNRIDACDLNNTLRSSLHSKIENPDYAEINRALNIKIFGHHQTGMRNLASTEELKKLNKLQENITFCIDMGFLHNSKDVINAIQKCKE